MKQILLWAMTMAMIIVPVKEFNDYTMEQTQTQMEDLRMRDLTSEEIEAINQIDALMIEVFDETWSYIN